MSEMQSEREHEIIKAQDIEEKSQVPKEEVQQYVSQIIESQFSGPIPPPNIIRGYEEVLPGSADRIFRMAEEQSDHRRKMEKEIIKAESRDSLLGVLFAFALGIGCLITAIIMVINVPESAGAIAGSVLGVTGIGSITASFIKSTRRNHGNERDDDSDKNTLEDD